MLDLGRACALCGNDLFAPLRDSKLRHICRCQTCDLVQVRAFPAPHELHEIYDEGYFRSEDSAEMGYTDYAADRDLIVRTGHRRLALLEKYTASRGRLLDVGCALGFFLLAAQKRGWDVRGVDISAHAASYAHEVLGFDARAGMLENAGFEHNSFDALTMWDVIEHVPDPVATLKTCASLLSPGGVIALSTPDIGSRVAKATGARWMGFKLAEEHLYYFSRQTMALALRQAGFQVVHEASTGKDIAASFFARRLALYAGPLSGVLAKALDVTRLGDHAVYVDPRDIMLMVGRKPPAAS